MKIFLSVTFLRSESLYVPNRYLDCFSFFAKPGNHCNKYHCIKNFLHGGSFRHVRIHGVIAFCGAFWDLLPPNFPHFIVSLNTSKQIELIFQNSIYNLPTGLLFFPGLPVRSSPKSSRACSTNCWSLRTTSAFFSFTS